MSNPKRDFGRPLDGVGFSVAGLTVAVLVGVVLASACNKSDDTGKAASIPPMAAAPSAAPPTPAPNPAPTPAPPPAAAPAVAMPPPAAPAAAAPPAKPDPSASIVGEIVLGGAVKKAVKPDDAIFLVARRISDNPTARGSLVAVKKFTAASFPIPFSLSAQDMMVPSGNFEGDLTLSVRVDKDGDPMSRRKGDVIGTLPKVRVGAKNVKLTLNQIQEQDENLAAPGPINHGGPLPPGHP